MLKGFGKPAPRRISEQEQWGRLRSLYSKAELALGSDG